MTHIELALGTAVSTDGKPTLLSRVALPASRALLGLLFFVMGLNGLLQFLPQPANAMPAGAEALTTAFVASGYLIPLLGITQSVVGALLLVNRFVPLALTILAPVVVNILAFHVFLAPQGLPIALVVVGLAIYLAFAHRAAFRQLLASRH